MRYRILTASTTYDLEYKVDEQLALGWTLHGGVCVTSHTYLIDGVWDTTYEYVQAMIEPVKVGL